MAACAAIRKQGEMMKKIILAALAGLLVMQQVKADGYGAVKDAPSFRKELIARTSAVTSIQADFVQEKFLSVFSTKVRSEGKFYWQKEDRICLDYRTPAKYRIAIAGDRIKNVSNGKSTVVSAKGTPMMNQMSSLITACMTGNLGAMGSGFRTIVEESASDYRITITPLSQNVKSYIARMEIYLDKKDLSVNRLVMYENGTDYTGYVFSGKKFNETIPASVFDVR